MKSQANLKQAIVCFTHLGEVILLTDQLYTKKRFNNSDHLWQS